MTRTPLIFIAAAVLLLGAGCGDSKSDAPTGPPTPSGTAAAETPAGNPTADPTDRALAISLARLAGFVLAPAEVPQGYAVRSNQPVSRREAAVANVAILPLATFLNLSDLEGAWLSFYVRPQPETSLSSRIYSFGQPASAAKLVETIAKLQTSDYPVAISVERVQADTIGDVSQMMRFRIPGGRSLEYTWQQGRYAGQIVLRYAGDIETTDDVGLIVSLARKQAAKMEAATQ